MDVTLSLGDNKLVAPAIGWRVDLLDDNPFVPVVTLIALIDSGPVDRPIFQTPYQRATTLAIQMKPEVATALAEQTLVMGWPLPHESEHQA
jgi:hypothetical protein